MKKEEASSTPTMGLQRLLSIQRNQQRRRRKILARSKPPLLSSYQLLLAPSLLLRAYVPEIIFLCSTSIFNLIYAALSLKKKIILFC